MTKLKNDELCQAIAQYADSDLDQQMDSENLESALIINHLAQWVEKGEKLHSFKFTAEQRYWIGMSIARHMIAQHDYTQVMTARRTQSKTRFHPPDFHL
jgi:hypothetical protein